MKTRIDPYFYMQPPLSFVEELKKPVHTKKPERFGREQLRQGEVSVKGAFLQNEFPDEEHLLDTATDDFLLFLQIYGVAGEQYPIRLVKGETACFESYCISVEADRCILQAQDTEGIRRGLIFLEDEMQRREGPILQLGEISRKPSIRSRITRGFFSPTNRPPKCMDELMDDVDYYPEEYLNRLAHDGTNGLWIYTYFKELLCSEYFEEYGKDWEKRISKLKKVVDKCGRYGIKVYVFGVEPSYLTPKMAEKYSDAVGYPVDWAGDTHYTLCTHSERGEKYCVEATQKLFELVPNLGGIIDITDGERVTACSSMPDMHLCPRCGQYARSRVLARNTDLLKEGMRRAGSNAEFISWTYAHREWEMKDIQDYIHCGPADVMYMENFEDNGYALQLGKTRQAIDYWLSYTGPSQMFEGAAQAAMQDGKQMFAKMQVCCSHELATVPYIPVPGILFDKYAAARKLGTTGVMQCWYFGNYPSLMSKAAGELSFMDDFSDKYGFLKDLAGIYYGSKAEEAVLAWTHFENGYRNYPINIMFSYYGPMHDGVVWDLALLPKNRPLSRSWLLMDVPDGDRIGECLQSGHTLDEAVLLTGMMKEEWKKGMELLPDGESWEQSSVAKALDILFDSGHQILKFYALRERLGRNEAEVEALLKEMEAIVDAQIKCSRDMICLCENDPRLGYHSEAEGYKFFPKKLSDRIEKLEQLKQTEFVEVRQRIAKGMPALAYYQGEDGGKKYVLEKKAISEASYETISEAAAFRASYDEDKLYIELTGKAESKFMLYFEYQLMWPAPGILIKGGELSLTECAISHQSVFGEKIDEELGKYELLLSEPDEGHYLLAISREKVGWNQDRPMKARIEADGISWIKEDAPVHTLGKEQASPGEFGWFLPLTR